MSHEIFRKLNELLERGEPCVLATVVRTEGSSSAKPGSKALLNAEGRNVIGWVGGGCAESAVRDEALRAVADGQSRVIEIDMTDEVLGVGMPCGGTMEVYIEPFSVKPSLVILGHSRVAEALATLGHLLEFTVTVDDAAATPEAFPYARLITHDPDLQAMGAGPSSYVVVATQHKSDDLGCRRALEADAPYIALIASRKRAKIVLDQLRAQSVSDDLLARIHSPAGFDLGAVTPEEIALSVMAEIVKLRRQGTGEPLRAQAEPAAASPAR